MGVGCVLCGCAGLSRYACSPCCLSMASVKATPGVCQASSQNAACRATCLLNTIGKWGVTTAAVFSCRPVSTSGTRTCIGPRGGSSIFGGMSSNISNLLILLVIGFVIYMILEHS